MFATLLMPYTNYKKQAGLNTQGRLGQQPTKDPVNRLNNLPPHPRKKFVVQ
jgi:hypothetical protein